MPDDDVQFKSPKTGKVQVVPPEQWEDAMSRGYTPTTHKVMYSPEGKRGMVPIGELTDYVKQGYQTTPKTQFEQGVTGEGISLKGAGTAAWNTLKSMAPPVPKGPILSKEFLLPDYDPNKPYYGLIKSNEESGIGQMGKEGSAEYQRARAAGVNPIAAGYSAAISGAGPLVGISDIQQQQLAKQGEGGQIIGQSAVPIAATLAGPAIGRALGGLPTENAPPAPGVGISPDVTGAAGRYIFSKSGVPGSGYVGEKIGRLFGTKGAISPEAVKAAAKAQAKAEAAAAKADAAARKAVPVSKGPGPYTGPSSVPPPDPFAGMTSTRAPVGSAELPPATGAQAPFPAVTRKAQMAAPPTPETPPSTGGPLDITQPKTSLLSRGRTVIQPGMEPDMSNPAHVKMINDYQTISGPKLRELAGAGDRFAAFVLRHMPRP